MALRNEQDEVTKERKISGQWLVVSGQRGSYFLLGWASRWPANMLYGQTFLVAGAAFTSPLEAGFEVGAQFQSAGGSAIPHT
ncbi:MAG: hypothetical protein WCC16_15945, partial [Candidatus Sulfotelmatobacter sp.]